MPERAGKKTRLRCPRAFQSYNTSVGYGFSLESKGVISPVNATFFGHWGSESAGQAASAGMNRLISSERARERDKLSIKLRIARGPVPARAAWPPRHAFATAPRPVRHIGFITTWQLSA